jgi:hypothetical protein
VSGYRADGFAEPGDMPDVIGLHAIHLTAVFSSRRRKARPASTWHTGDGFDSGYANVVYADWTATAGAHTVAAWWTASYATTCDFVVEA